MSDVEHQVDDVPQDEDAKVYELPVKTRPTPDTETPAQVRSAATELTDATDADGAPEASDHVSVVDGELVAPTMVDQSHDGFDREARKFLRGLEKRLPILPPWLKSRQEFTDTASWALSYLWHVSAFHALRSPVYAAKLVARMPQGVGRLVGGLAAWATDAEGRPVRYAAARREDAHEYLKLAMLRDGRVRTRTFVVIISTAGGLVVVAAGAAFLPVVLQWAAVVVAAGGLGFFGAPPDKPVISRAVESTKVPRLTSNVVEAALASLGIAGINQAMGKGGQGIVFPKPISRDGKGWRADVDLPLGVTAGDVMERRPKLASGLRRSLGCVWPEGDPSEHPGRLVLWVGDQDMRKANQPKWPLAKGGAVDLFKPQPFGTDQRGRWVKVSLIFVSIIVGSIPRMGKTFAVRELLLIAGLDPRAELHCYDLKGLGDLDPLEPVAHRHGVGGSRETIAALAADIKALREELERRGPVIRKLAKQGLCPENKVTPELASKKSLGLHPIVLGIDECQIAFEDSEFGEQLAADCEDLVRRGPAAGITVILATQRPDSKSLPTTISANASTRYCLKVQGQTENDMVLGTSKYKQGIRATTFAWEDKGIGYLLGEGSDAQIVRTVNGLDAEESKKIVAYARALREHAGTLSGHATGQQPKTADTARDTLLDDVLTVVPDSEKKVWNERVISRLQELRPEVYGTFTKAEDLTAALKRHGIRTGQVWGITDGGKGASRIGITRADLANAVADRNRKRSDG